MKHATFPALRERILDELLFHWPTVVRMAPKGWAHDFALSIAQQSRRRGWKPSEKQAALMQRLVADLFVDPINDDFELIEGGE